MKIVKRCREDDIIDATTTHIRDAVTGWGKMGYTEEIASQSFLEGVKAGLQLAMKNYDNELPHFS